MPIDEFMTTSRGAVDFGHIDPTTAEQLGIPSGPIRMLRGNKKFGYEHVCTNLDRMKKINGLGFSDFCEYAECVCANFTKIKSDENNRQIIIHYHKAHGLRIVLFPQREGDCFYWSILTGIPGRMIEDGQLYAVPRDQPTLEVESLPQENRPRRAILKLKN